MAMGYERVLDKTPGGSGGPDLEELRANEAVKRLTAIAHKGRLGLLRRLVQAGPQGIVAGELARSVGVGATTASAQLQLLGNADLVTSQRDGRQIIYRANYSSLEGLLGYLLEDCCCCRPEICNPIAERLRESDVVSASL